MGREFNVMFRETKGLDFNNFKTAPNSQKSRETKIPDDENSLLNPEQKNELQALAHDFFNNYLKNNEQAPVDDYRKYYELEDKINSYFSKADKKFNPNEEYAGRIREANKITISELLKFCEENQKEPNFNQFLKVIKDIYFSSSPCLSSNLDIEDKFGLAAKATRSAEIYGQIGSCMVDDLVYSLSWEYGQENFTRFLETFKKKSFAEQFDEIHLIKLLSADAAGTGTSERGLDNLRLLLQSMKTGTNSAFLRYAINLTERQLDKEEVDPSLGIVKYSDDKGNLRLNESLSLAEKEESDRLEKIVYSNIPIQPGDKLVRVAADAMAVIDHSNTPVSYGPFSADEYNQKKERPAKISLVDLKKIENVFSHNKKINVENLISAVNDRIFSPYYEIDSRDRNKLADLWSQLDSGISRESWLEFFSNQDKIDQLKDDLRIKRANINAKAKNQNLQATDNFLDYFNTAASKILEAEHNANLQSIWEKFVSGYRQGNSEKAYSAVVDFVSGLNLLKSFDKKNNQPEKLFNGKDVCGQLWLGYEGLKKEHHNNFVAAEKLTAELYESAGSRHAKLLENYERERSLINANFAEVAKGLANKLQTLGRNLKNDALEINFYDYNSLSKDSQMADYINDKETEEISLFLKHMHRPDMEAYINDQVGIDLKEIPFRYQIYLLRFLSENNEERVREIAAFINEAKTEEDKINRIKSFLCLNIDYGIGEAIINLGKKLKPEQINQLLSKVAEINDSSETQDVSRMYQEIFFDKNIDTKRFVRASLSRASNLLTEANIKVNDPATSAVDIDKLVSSFNEELLRSQENLAEFGEMAKKLNEVYRQLGIDVLEGLASPYDDAAEIADDQNFPQMIKDFDEATQTLIRRDFEQHKKFSAERIKEMIEYYRTMAEVESCRPEAIRQVLAELKKEEGSADGETEASAWSEKIKKYHDVLSGPISEEQALYEEAIKKLQQALPLQIALENKMDQLIYGQEETKLPNGFSNFENNEVKPENIPDQAPLYFPVGISKDLPSWEAVFENEKKAAKPIDIYGYLFWLNNQGRKVNLVICDEIQVNNYQVRYGKSESAARQKAGEIGDCEARQYEKIIDTFGLDNIKVQRYQEFLSGNQKDYERYNGIVKNLKESPVFKEAFFAMVQESVSGAEKEEYIGYALEELAWILSTNGTKIGHLNEARYDILGSVIRNFEQVGKEKGFEVLDNPESPEAKVLLNTICKLIRDSINEKKSKLAKGSPSLAYFQRLQDHLGKIKTDSKAGLDKTIKKDSLSLNFVCPEVGSASFGFRGDFEEKESVVKFKEPYSTYFYKNDSDLLVNSDQVVAAGEGLIGGKILTLDNKKQLKYAESVVRPILKHYFANLEKAPAGYFEKIDKSREELLSEAKEATSLLEILRFIQRYIVKPTELN